MLANDWYKESKSFQSKDYQFWKKKCKKGSARRKRVEMRQRRGNGFEDYKIQRAKEMWNVGCAQLDRHKNDREKNFKIVCKVNDHNVRYS